jgi:hypothetical protein
MATNSPGSTVSDIFCRIWCLPTRRLTSTASIRPPFGDPDVRLERLVLKRWMVDGSNVDSVMIGNLRDS